PHYGMGIALYRKGDMDGAIAAYEKAIALMPKHVGAHNNLGNALQRKGDFDAAAAWYHKALVLSPNDPYVHCALGNSLRWQGKFAEAVKHYEHGNALGKKVRGWKDQSKQLTECKRLLELDERLPAILAGTVPIKDAAERAEVAQLCYLI